MTRAPFATATLSHGDIRSELYRLLDESVGYVFIVDCWDGYCIYETFEERPRLFRQDYTIDEGDAIALSGEPIEVEEAYVKVGTMDVVASAVTPVPSDATSAATLLASFKSSNPLIGSITASKNSHLVVLDLTTIGRPSQHQGRSILLEQAGLKDAARTLITKPVHVTRNFDGHVDAGSKPVAIGTFLAAIGLDNEDGTTTLRTVATLWEEDFPEEVAEIQANRAIMGGSYEIQYSPLLASRDGNVIRIPSYAFTGGAILLKAAAAHPETQLQVADNQKKAAPAVPRREPATARGSSLGTPSPAAQGGRTMKFPGITDPAIEGIVDGILANREVSWRNEHLVPITAERDALRTERDTLASKVTTLEASGVATTNELTQTKLTLEAQAAELTQAKEKLGTFEAAAAEAAKTKKVDDKWAELKASFGLEDAMRKDREPLLVKLVAGQEPLTGEEMKQLISGGKVVPMPVPLYAGKGDVVSDPAAATAAAAAAAAGLTGTEAERQAAVSTTFPAAMAPQKGSRIFR